MSKTPITYTDTFADEYQAITSNVARKRIRQAVDSIATFPDMGAAMPRRSLAQRYGEDIRTLPAGTYVIVYRHQDAHLVLLALVPGKLIV